METNKETEWEARKRVGEKPFDKKNKVMNKIPKEVWIFWIIIPILTGIITWSIIKLTA